MKKESPGIGDSFYKTQGKPGANQAFCMDLGAADLISSLAALA